MERDNANKPAATVEIIDGGPLKIKGKILLKDLKKDFQERREEVYLCRCGNSGNKPFCDSSHKNNCRF